MSQHMKIWYLLLIALASIKSSDEPAQLSSLTRAFAADTHKVGRKMKALVKIFVC